MKAIRALLYTGGVIAVSACSTLKTPTFTDDRGAIRGYDPVAYHREMMPVKGDPAFAYEYNDSVWYFSSEHNLATFRSDPERYVPAYGGYCAYAMSKGYVVSTDPQAWTIEGEKLYLNYSLNVRETWLKDVPGYIAKADTNWLDKLSSQDFE